MLPAEGPQAQNETDPRDEPSSVASSADAQTAAAFASSWNAVRVGSVYTRDQFLDWFSPVDPASLAGQTVLELGFGNGSQLCHVGDYRPARLCGIELGDTLEQTRKNLQHLPKGMLELYHGDLTTADLGRFDFVYCIGVLHHLENPENGFESVLRHTRPGGRFHCWVYGREGNGVVIHLVDPIRRFASKLPWWVNKFGVAFPLAVPYYAYAKSLQFASRRVRTPMVRRILGQLPLEDYSLWIAQRPFAFFHHVAFDQLVTPQTHYIGRAQIESWLRHPDVDPTSTYIIQRNGNSWKFGGHRREDGRPGLS
ncbi:MAG TPA: class I SAM-dependent methyltransferase [Polyangiaceae bacterium]|nr:class I SAM-dependent methyltransferase [Polyangiaceae bacterium]